MQNSIQYKSGPENAVMLTTKSGVSLVLKTNAQEIAVAAPLNQNDGPAGTEEHYILVEK